MCGEKFLEQQQTGKQDAGSDQADGQVGDRNSVRLQAAHEKINPVFERFGPCHLEIVGSRTSLQLKEFLQGPQDAALMSLILDGELIGGDFFADQIIPKQVF